MGVRRTLPPHLLAHSLASSPNYASSLSPPPLAPFLTPSLALHSRNHSWQIYVDLWAMLIQISSLYILSVRTMADPGGINPSPERPIKAHFFRGAYGTARLW